MSRLPQKPRLKSICIDYASVNSSGALPPPPPPGNPGAFAHVVSLGGGAFVILSRPGAGHLPTPGHLTHVFSKVPWRNSSAKTRRLLRVRD